MNIKNLPSNRINWEDFEELDSAHVTFLLNQGLNQPPTFAIVAEICLSILEERDIQTFGDSSLAKIFVAAQIVLQSQLQHLHDLISLRERRKIEEQNLSKRKLQLKKQMKSQCRSFLQAKNKSSKLPIFLTPAPSSEPMMKTLDELAKGQERVVGIMREFLQARKKSVELPKQNCISTFCQTDYDLTEENTKKNMRIMLNIGTDPLVKNTPLWKVVRSSCYVQAKYDIVCGKPRRETSSFQLFLYQSFPLMPETRENTNAGIQTEILQIEGESSFFSSTISVQKQLEEFLHKEHRLDLANTHALPHSRLLGVLAKLKSELKIILLTRG